MSVARSRLFMYVRHPWFGLTETEAMLLRRSMNGIMEQPHLIPDNIAEHLAGGVSDIDLAEKLRGMAPDKAAQLYHFMVGYMSGWTSDV